MAGPIDIFAINGFTQLAQAAGYYFHYSFCCCWLVAMHLSAEARPRAQRQSWRPSPSHPAQTATSILSPPGQPPPRQRFTLTPTLSPTPTASATITPTPAPLPAFTSRLLRVGVKPASYLNEPCDYLRLRWSPEGSAPGTDCGADHVPRHPGSREKATGRRRYLDYRGTVPVFCGFANHNWLIKPSPLPS